MVKNATSYSGNGLRDWLVQRVSAVILGLFMILMLVVFSMHPVMDYATWQGLFSQLWMKVFTIITFLALFGHAWVGIWTVLTDYIKPVMLRMPLQILVILSLLIYLIWGIDIVWSI